VKEQNNKELVRFRRNFVAKNNKHKGGYHSRKKYTRLQKHLRLSYEN